MSTILRNTVIEGAAKVAHEVNRAYCLANGDASQPSWVDAPDWQVESAKQGVQFVLDNMDAEPSAQHDNWMAQKVADGWVYGETKCADAKTHPCLVPFEDLPAFQQTKDILFRAVVVGFC
jgi:RyR domain